MGYVHSSIKVTFFRSSLHFYQIQSDKVILACCTDETKLWLSPSAKQCRNPCSGPPPVYQDLSTSHDWLAKKIHCQFSNEDERKFVACIAGAWK